MTVLAFSGGIAVGKTTLVRRLGRLFPDYKAVEEGPTQNVFLADFYQDKKRWGFHSRIAMLDLFYHRITHAEQSFERLILDRFIFELEVFAKLQAQSGNLSENEYRLYERVYERFCDGVRWPNVVVRVRCSPLEAARRMRLRGRSFESNVSADYLANVENAYDVWLSGAPREVEVFEFDNTQEASDEQLVQTFKTFLHPTA